MLELKVPDDRVGALIGREGEIKKRIEESTGCRIRINSRTGVVTIECSNSIDFLRVQDVVKAIGYGFNPEVALKLLSSDFMILEVIDLTDFVSSPNAIQRIKGRIIGKEGKMRKAIEDMLGVNVSVYAKTVSIIGDLENVASARETIVMLIEGAQHSTVQRFLERKRREIKMRSLDWHVP
jgi:ribosomal RNA assembly protein